MYIVVNVYVLSRSLPNVHLEIQKFQIYSNECNEEPSNMFAYTLIGVGYIVLGLISGLLADAFHIDIKPRSSLDYNGRMVSLLILL